MAEIKHYPAGWEAKAVFQPPPEREVTGWGVEMNLKKHMVFRKGNGVMKRDGKTSSSRIIPFVGPQPEAQLRHEEAERI